MKSNFKMQWRLMTSQKSFYWAMFFMIALSCVTFIINCFTVFGRPITAVPNAHFFYLGSAAADLHSVFSLLLPLVAAFPFADSYFRDRKKNTLSVILMKTSAKNYYFSKLLVVFFSGFLIAFIPLLINYFLNFIAFPLTRGCDFTMFPVWTSSFFEAGKSGWLENIFLKELFVPHPYLYNFIFLILTSVLGGLFAAMAYNVSFFIKKQLVFVIAFPFVLTNAVLLVSSAVNLALRLASVDFIVNTKIENYFYAFSNVQEMGTIGMVIVAMLYGVILFGFMPLCLKKLRDIL